MMVAAVVMACSATGGAASGQGRSQREPAKRETVTQDPDSVGADEAPVDPGRQLYARHCAACHGEQGNGQGKAAAYLFPRPRDIRAGRFRLLSTSNNVPTREDLHAVLLRGMPGSSMPPWGHLLQQERDALVDEVMRLRIDGAREYYIKVLKEQDDLTDEEIAEDDIQEEIQEYIDNISIPGESSVVPDIGEPNEETLNDAKEVYAKAGCLQCHGKEGKGDGVQKMIDDEGLPTAPRDFTVGIFKGGADPASMYRRIAYGMPGTPMPGSRQLTPEQMMNLAHYIRSMSTEEQQRQAAVLNRGTLTVKAVGALTSEANDASWSEVPPVSFRMTPLWWRNNADPDLQVQAIHDGRRSLCDCRGEMRKATGRPSVVRRLKTRWRWSSIAATRSLSLVWVAPVHPSMCGSGMPIDRVSRERLKISIPTWWWTSTPSVRKWWPRRNTAVLWPAPLLNRIFPFPPKPAEIRLSRQTMTPEQPRCPAVDPAVPRFVCPATNLFVRSEAGRMVVGSS